MPQTQNNIAGLLLAGGRSDRFAGNDKGLRLWQQKPLAEHALQRLATQVNSVTISCNRHVPRYQQIASRYARQGQILPLCLEDSALEAYSGPLAGIFSLLEYVSRLAAKTNAQKVSLPDYLMVCCCDNPVLPVDIVARLAHCLVANKATAVYPVINSQHARLTLLLHIETATAAMRQFMTEHALALEQGAERKLSVKNWLATLATATCELDDESAAQNINRPSDLAKLDADKS